MFKFSIAERSTTKVFKISCYQVYQDKDGYYGIAKIGDRIPHCGYKCIDSMLTLKGLKYENTIHR